MQGKLAEERLLLDYWEIRALLDKGQDMLSERDVKWLEELAAGKQLKQLTTEHKSLTSVKSRLKVIRRLLKAGTNAEAVAIAIRTGVIK